MRTTRIAPLPMRYKRMKLRSFDYWQKRGFKGYKSPWIPVSKSNKPLIKEGDLVIGDNWFEQPYRIGRDTYEFHDGKVIDIQTGEPLSLKPRFVWVGPYEKDVSKYLWNNSLAEEYSMYSELVEKALRNGDMVIEDVRFPLFHETSLENAQNILENGIDSVVTQFNNITIYGNAFCTGPCYEDTIGKGAENGAMLKFVAWEGAPPRWVRIDWQTSELMRYFSFEYPSKNLSALYTTRALCYEMSASSVFTGGALFIYDSFEEYVADEIKITNH